MPKVLNVYKHTFTYGEGKLSADVSVSASEWTTIWKYTVGSNEAFVLGRADGYFYIKVINTSGNQFHGIVRIVVESPDGSIRKALYTISTRVCGDISDITKKPRLPRLHKTPIPENWKILIQMKAESSDTLDYDNAGNLLAMDCYKLVLA